MGLPAGMLRAGYTGLVRPLLFASHGGDPEAVHDLQIGMLAGIGRTAPLRGLLGLVAGSGGVPETVAGIRFPGRVGLAAGLDKDGLAARVWSRFGFGFAELGTVTARAQPGNDRPRVFRAPQSQALINRMGFNNRGAVTLAETLRAAGIARGNGVAGIPLGVSLGKTKAVPIEDAVADYLAGLEAVAPVADYVAINVSSPNTPKLRSLQSRAALAELTDALVTRAAALAAQPDCAQAELGSSAPRPLPVFVKLAPDLSWPQVDEVLSACEQAGVAGVIATNTTLGRDGLAPADRHLATEAGGLSGAPLTARALEVVGYVTARTKLPVIGAGGIMTAADGLRMFDAGARLVELYTGFIYAGPGLVSGINSADARRKRA